MIDEMMTLLESDDEAKAPTRQITGHDTIEIRQVQQEEFATAVYHKCSRHQEVPPGDEVEASRPCEAKCEQTDDPGEATSQFHSCVRGGAQTSTKRRKL